MFGDPVTNPMGWDVTTIKKVVANSQYGTSQKSNTDGIGYPILGMGNITYSGEIVLDDLSFVDLSAKEFASLKLESGDVLFNRTNSYDLVGKTAVWNYDIDMVAASYLVRIKLRDDVLPEYFAALLNMPYYKQLFELRCRKGVNQANISPTYLKEFPFMKPPAALQEKFTQIVIDHRFRQEQSAESARQAEHLFQTLLHQAFRGEL